MIYQSDKLTEVWAVSPSRGNPLCYPIVSIRKDKVFSRQILVECRTIDKKIFTLKSPYKEKFFYLSSNHKKTVYNLSLQTVFCAYG